MEQLKLAAGKVSMQTPDRHGGRSHLTLVLDAEVCVAATT